MASFNEYRGGGADRKFWLSVWSSSNHAVDRKGGKESIDLPHPFAAMLGGLQPDMLSSLKEERGRNDGFIDRLACVYPELFPPQRWTEQVVSPEAQAIWAGVVERLFGLPMRAIDGYPSPWLARFTPEAKELFVAWFDEHCEESEDDAFDDRLQGPWAKLRAHAARFALILSRVRLACHPTQPMESNGAVPSVEADDVRGAVALANYLKSQLTRIGHAMTRGVGSADALTLLEWITRKRLAEFREADATADLRRFRGDPASLGEALADLVRLGAIRSKPEAPEPGKRGPKPTPLYEVHPDLLRAPEITVNTANSPSEPPPEPISGNSGNSWRSAEYEAADGKREVFEL